MRIELFRKEILPFILWFLLLLILSRVSDELLHWSGLGWVGSYLAYPGVGLILLSFIYSVRKARWIPLGWFDRISLKSYLAFHELTAWFGVYLILIHAGIHMHAWLPWLATVVMLISVISGFTGHILQARVSRAVKEKKSVLLKDGQSPTEVEEKIFRAALMAKAMLKWRKFHRPLTAVFAGFALMHIITAMFFMSWRGL